MRTAFAWILIAAGCLGCSGSAPLPPKAAELNQRGVDALARGELELADARFSLALEYSPRFVEALTNLGLLELQRGNFERARKLLTKARRVNPDVAQPHHGLGVLAEREGLRDRAADHYRDALRVDPGFVPARANLARLLFDAGQLEHARIEFSKLIEADPADPAGYAGLTASLLGLGRVAEADTVVVEAQQRFPKSPEIELLACRKLLRAGQPQKAVLRLSRLLDRRDDVAVAALGWLGTAELALGRPHHAVGAARRALALKADDPVAVYVMAMALDRLGDPKSRAWLERALLLAPGHRQLQAMLEQSEKEASKPGAAPKRPSGQLSFP